MDLLRNTLDVFLEILQLIIFLRVIFSWVPQITHTTLYKFLYEMTEPFLSPIRNMIERSEGFKNLSIDITPLITVVIIDIIRRIV